MLDRKFMYLLILASLALIFILNVYVSIPTLWLLLWIPAIAVVILDPTRKATMIIGMVCTVLMVVAEFVLRQNFIHPEEAVQLLVTGAVGWAVFLMASLSLIKSRKLIKRLRGLALTDPLTDIHNRRYLELYMEKAIPICQRNDDPMTLIIFDIDHFKSINDSYGHNAGDMVLKKVAEVVKRMIRHSDVFIRTGGEEFIILLPSCPLQQGIKLAERIRKEIESTSFTYKETRIWVTVSMGITEYIRGQDLHQFIERADQALYRAKNSGRNRVVAI